MPIQLGDSYRTNVRWSVFTGILYVCFLLECTISISANKNKNSNRYGIYPLAVNEENAPIYEKHRQLLYRRHRRKLPSESSSNDQLNSLDNDFNAQYQEYQGVFGRPGIDFPTFSSIPVTKFNCRNVKNSHNGYYADLETNCQVFHVCDGGRKVSFLCPNGTIFRQSHLICDWWFRVDCANAPQMYDQNIKPPETDPANYKQQTKTISHAMHGVTDPMLFESPVSLTNKLNDDYNTHADLPHRSNPYRHRVNIKFPGNQQQPTQSPTFVHREQNTIVPPDHSPNFVNREQNTIIPPEHSPTFVHREQNTIVPPEHSPTFVHREQNTIVPPESIDFPSTPTKSYDFNSFFRNPEIASNLRAVNQNYRATATTATPSQDATKYTNIVANNFNNFDATPSGLFSYRNNNDNFDSTTSTKSKASTQTTANLSELFASFRQFGSSTAPSIETDFRSSSNTTPLPRSTATRHNGIVTPASSYNTDAPLPQTTDFASYPANTIPPTTYSPFVSTGNVPYRENDLREQQVLAETAAFDGKRKYTDYYYLQNSIPQLTSGSGVKKTNEYFSPSSTDASTSLADGTRTEDKSFALYHLTGPSDQDDDDIFNLFTTTTVKNDESIFDPIQRANKSVSKPSISQFLLIARQPNVQYITSTTTEVPQSHTIPILLTNQTQQRYQELFPSQNISQSNSDLQSEFSSGLVQSNSPKQTSSSPTVATGNQLNLKTPDIRELAQIFSRALSAYLDDPENFRRILSEVRPTEPPPLGSINSEHSSSKDEVLTFSEDNDHRTRATPSSSTAATTQTIEDPETFAEVINNFMQAEQTMHNLPDSEEFNVNETYYPYKTTNGNTSVTFAVSPIIDFTASTKTTPPITATNNFSPTVTQPVFKINVLDDTGSSSDKLTLSDSNAQSISDDQLLITADTQSFVSRNNLARYQNRAKGDESSPPLLKTFSYPRFGLRRTTASTNSFVNSRANRTTVTARLPQTTVVDNLPSQTTLDEELPILTTPSNNLIDTEINPNLAYVLNASTVNAVMDMMEGVKTNDILRNKLVLLLVNDRTQPENRSIRDMKNKLLKALIVPASTTGLPENPVTAFTVAQTRRMFVPREPKLYPTTTTELITPASLPSVSSTDNNYEYLRLDEKYITRNARSTATQSRPVQSTTRLLSTTTSKPENGGSDADNLSEADARAVDLLKTLYSIASRHHWSPPNP